MAGTCGTQTASQQAQPAKRLAASQRLYITASSTGLPGLLLARCLLTAAAAAAVARLPTYCCCCYKPTCHFLPAWLQVQCSVCGNLNDASQANQLGHIVCGGCQVTLAYAYGAQVRLPAAVQPCGHAGVDEQCVMLFRAACILGLPPQLAPLCGMLPASSAASRKRWQGTDSRTHMHHVLSRCPFLPHSPCPSSRSSALSARLSRPCHRQPARSRQHSRRSSTPGHTCSSSRSSRRRSSRWRPAASQLRQC